MISVSEISVSFLTNMVLKPAHRISTANPDADGRALFAVAPATSNEERVCAISPHTVKYRLSHLCG